MAATEDMTQSALMILVPEAEELVSGWRERLDPVARLGVPAHITLRFPYASPTAITADLRTQLREAFGTFGSFDFTLGAVDWFAERVVYLAPEPGEPFRRLAHLVSELPGSPPPRDPSGEVVPHLTFGAGAPVDLLREAAAAVEPHLPLTATATEVVLMSGGDEPGSWRVDDRYPLRET
jgi:2'-5' RNA ligase